MTIVCVRKRPGHPMRATPIPAEVAARFRVASGAGRRTS
jgi:hypothetical protein